MRSRAQPLDSVQTRSRASPRRAATNHLPHRVISVLSSAALLLLGAFGIYFSFANYPAFGIGVTLSIAVLVGYSERSRRKKQRELERARRRGRTRSRIGVS